MFHVIRNQDSLKSWHNFSVTKKIKFYRDMCVFSMYDHCVLKSMWFSLELHTISACLRFICCFLYCSCAPPRVKMEKHLYLFSVYVGQTEWVGWMLVILTHLLCLQWVHRDTMALTRRGCVPCGSCLCLYALGCWFCYLLTLQCWWLFVISSNEISDWEQNIWGDCKVWSGFDTTFTQILYLWTILKYLCFHFFFTTLNFYSTAF